MMRRAESHTASIARIIRCLPVSTSSSRHSSSAVTPGSTSAGSAFPGRFEDIDIATAFCRSFFPWYHTEHRHAGIAMLTPHDVHYGRAHQVLEQRERTLRLAWSQHPERFVHGTPKPQPLPQEVWTNPPAAATTPPPAQ